jgi:hypothetical protein
MLRALECHHFSSEEAVSITYPVFVLAALVIQNALRMRHIVFRCLHRSAIFFPHFPTKGTILEKSY